MEAEERPRKIPRLSHHPAANDEATFEDKVAAGKSKSESLITETSARHEAGKITENGHSNQDTLPELDPENENVRRPDEQTPNPLSKNQQKKLRRKQQWEAGKAERKAKEKEKRKEAKARKREERANDPSFDPEAATKAKRSRQRKSKVVPVTFIIDCDFNNLMLEHELKSLAAQITRSYSDNRNALYKAHIAISSFKTTLKDRFENVLHNNHEKWGGVQFLTEDFVAVAEQAKEWMFGSRGGEVLGALKKEPITQEAEANGEQPHPDVHHQDTNGSTSRDLGTKQEGEVIYLSSESDNTITELKPYSTYIIGGLVDHNRHKGICHRRATERGVKTARLPIGEFLDMSSRKVLATNHVVEIMLKWLEFGDWGKAFMEVIPKRKGGTLKDPEEAEAAATDGGGNEAEANAQADGEKERSQSPESADLATITPA
jgi:tRNA (guanine9-N1)-methyltransferase